MGQPIDHSPRTSLLAGRMMKEMGYGLDGSSKATALGLIRWAGCTANAHGFSELFGDDIASRAGHIESRSSLVRSGEFLGPLDQYLRPLATAQCEATVEMVKQLGLSADVGVGARDLFEHWDGSGIPVAKKGDQIDLLAQIVALASDLEILSRVFGPMKALQLIESRGGKHYDANLARVVVRHGPSWLLHLSQLDPWMEAALVAEVAVVDPEIDLWSLTRLLADYSDLKVPRHFQISRKAAEVAAYAGSLLGMRSGVTECLGRAALLHGLGRVAVPNTTLEKSGNFNEADNEYTRLIPYWTERILKRAPDLEAEASLASQAFERLDGSGYPKGLKARSLSEEARVLQASVFVATIWHEQDGGRAGTLDSVMRRIQTAVNAGKLDKCHTDAALIACGLQKASAHRQQPPTFHITDREREVLLHLAKGRTNKEIARILMISPSTAGTHVENIYRKLDVSTRAAAALAALRLELVDI